MRQTFFLENSYLINFYFVILRRKIREVYLALILWSSLYYLCFFDLEISYILDLSSMGREGHNKIYFTQ